MTRLWKSSVLPVGAAVLLAACQNGASEGTAPLSMADDLTVQTVASASCTRGNNPVVLSVGPDGRASGRIVGSSRSFAGTLRAEDAKTVVFMVEEGALLDERLEQAMQPAQDGDTVVLRGGDFVCKDVFVRRAG